MPNGRPWERYQQGDEDGPWARYQQPEQPRTRNMPRSSSPSGRRPGAQRTTPLPSGYTEAAGAIANTGAGLMLGLHDETTGFLGGIGDAAGAVVQGRNPAEAYQRGYRREADRTRSYRDQFLRDHWLVGNALQGTGAAAPILATGGAAAAPQITRAGSRGLSGLVRQSAEAGAVGAPIGYVYAAGSADGAPLEERMARGNEGAATGAVAGAVAPTAVRAAAPLVRGVANLAERIPVPVPNSVGALGRPMRRAPPSQPPTVSPRVGRAVDRLADRSGQTADQIEARLQAAQARPQGQVLADVFDTPGAQTVRSMTQFPGRTAQVATERARERFQSAPERILSDLNRRLRVAETPEQALQSLERQYAEASANNYRPIWEAPINVESRAALEARLRPYQNDPVFQRAVHDAEEIFRRDARNGLVSGAIDDNFARYAHYLKLGLDDAAQLSANPASGGVGRTQLRGIREMRARIIEAIDDTVPGYRDARARWGGLVEAEDALGDGAAMIRQSHTAIAARMQEMTPFARYHARVGFANELANRLGLRGSVNGNRNIAEALGSPEMQRRVAAMFDTPEEAAGFLDTLNQQNMLMRNASQWNGGSSTAANLAYQEDGLANALIDAGGNIAAGRPAAAASGAWGQIRNAATLGLQERANNEVGAALLRKIDDAEARDFAEAVIADLRKRERERNAIARVSRAAGGGAGVVGNRRE